jgi:small-conductance mechanosensitive channel
VTLGSGGEAGGAPAVGVPVGLAVLAAGTLLWLPELLPLGRYERWLRTGITVLLVGSCAVAVARVTVAAVTEYAARRPSLTPALGVARMSARIVVGILAVLTGLQALGVPVTPLLTTLGIGSLAVALALQDTLANFFAGLYLLADRPVRPGDYVKLTEGAEGFVETIGWRSSRLRTPAGNNVIVPNQKLSQSILTNFHLPRPDLALVVPVAVPYQEDAARIEGLLVDELLSATRDVPEIVSKDPAARLVELGPSSMVFHCVVQVRDFDSQGRAAHELRKRILARLRREGIQLPYPQQVVHLVQGPDKAPPTPR